MSSVDSWFYFDLQKKKQYTVMYRERMILYVVLVVLYTANICFTEIETFLFFLFEVTQVGVKYFCATTAIMFGRSCFRKVGLIQKAEQNVSRWLVSTYLKLDLVMI